MEPEDKLGPENQGGPENKLGLENLVGPENKVVAENQVRPGNKVVPENRLGPRIKLGRGIRWGRLSITYIHIYIYILFHIGHSLLPMLQLQHADRGMACTIPL